MRIYSNKFAFKLQAAFRIRDLFSRQDANLVSLVLQIQSKDDELMSEPTEQTRIAQISEDMWCYNAIHISI